MKVVALATSFFAVWIGMLMMLKVLILEEYRIAFHGFSLALLGALVLAKVVLILEHVPLGAWIRNKPVWVDVLLRTVLYSLGVLVVLLLEKAFEGRHDHGGFLPSLLSLYQRADIYHVWASAIVLSGALLAYNILGVFRCHLGDGGLLRMLTAPYPQASPAPLEETPPRRAI